MASTTCNDALSREETATKVASCFAWLALFGLFGVLATVLVTAVCAKWSDRDNARRSHALMIEQMEQIRRGEIKCLVQPDPSFIDELLADAKCVANIQEVYLGGDVSDEQLGRLRELPNLKCLVLLFVDNPDIFLERLQGMTTIEELTLERTWASRRAIEFMNTFPKLKSLSLPVVGNKVGDLDGIKNNVSIENLVIGRVGCDNRLLPLLQSLPHLRSVTIEDAERGEESFEASLRKALPHCRCSVRLGP